MVPVNGTRVGRVGERKRSEVHFDSSATGTAVFDKSAMNRLKKKMNEERIGYRWVMRRSEDHAEGIPQLVPIGAGIYREYCVEEDGPHWLSS
jgi:hypothetical protein